MSVGVLHSLCISVRCVKMRCSKINEDITRAYPDFMFCSDPVALVIANTLSTINRYCIYQEVAQK